MHFDLSDFIAVFFLVVALLLVVWGGVELLIGFVEKKHKKAPHQDALILNKRLAEQNKAQLRMIKERDAADSDLFDKVEEYRNDFGGPGSAH